MSENIVHEGRGWSFYRNGRREAVEITREAALALSAEERQSAARAAGRHAALGLLHAALGLALLVAPAAEDLSLWAALAGLAACWHAARAVTWSGRARP
jgi:hypothetical protein